MNLDHIVLACSDVEASARFYNALLPLVGFRKTRNHVYVNEQGVGLDLRSAKDPSYAYRRAGVGVNHIAVAASSRDAVDEVRRGMLAAGFEVPEPQQIDEAYALFLPDRDGMRLEVSYEPRARESS